MADEIQLTPNPDGCRKFEPNAFKKERCKQCGHPWTAHSGAIDDSIVQGHMAALQKVAEEKLRAEEAAKAKAKAKKLAKQKQVQAVEDEWLFDGSKERADTGDIDSDDDDMGFKMFTPDMMGNANLEKPRQGTDANKQLKVVNLIDFGECDVIEEPTPVAVPLGVPAQSGAAMAAAPGLKPGGLGASAASALAATDRLGGASAGGGDSGTSGAGALLQATCLSSLDRRHGRDLEKEGLEEELEHLRQMLRDANEEKSIHLAIVQDEVAEKQSAIEELTQQRTEAEAALLEARNQVQARDEEVARLRLEVDQLRAERSIVPAIAYAEADLEVEGLRAEKASLTKQLDSARAAQAAAEAKAVVAVQGVQSGVMVDTVDGFSPLEAYTSAQEMKRHATEELRDLRIKADRQLAWMIKRMRESHLDLAQIAAAGGNSQPLL